MSSIINKLKGTFNSGSDTQSDNQEQSFTIQPHPAKTNDPADLQEPPQVGAGLNSKPEFAVHNARGPYVPSEEVRANMGKPASRDELRARAEELNR